MKKTLIEYLGFIYILIISLILKKVLGFEYAVLGLLSIILMNQYNDR